MKKYIFFAIFSISAAMLLCGCVTSKVHFTPPLPEQKPLVPEKTEVVGNVKGSNWGLFLFNSRYLPISSGNYRRPDTGDYHLFRNWIKPGYMREMLLNRAKKEGADHLQEVEIKQSSTGLFSLFIVWRRDIEGTAVAVKRTSDD